MGPNQKNRIVIVLAVVLALGNVSFISNALGEALENSKDSGRNPASESNQQKICSDVNLPSQFSIKALTSDSRYRFAVVDVNNKVVAFIKQNAAAVGRFEFLDNQDALIMVGKEKNASTGNDIELYDCNNNKIGTIKPDMEKSFLSATTSYSIRDDKGNLIFVAEKRNEESKFISIFDKDQTEMAAISIERSQKKYEAQLKRPTSNSAALMLMATLKAYADTK